MSKRSRQKKWRRATTQQRRQQMALCEDTSFGEETEATIGQLVDRLNRNRMDAMQIKTMPPVNGEIAVIEQREVTPIVVAAPAPVLLANPPTDWPVCPSNCDPIEWQRALESRDYYLKMAKDDGNKKPWFQYPKFAYQYSEFVYITPEMAQELLSHMPVNRKKKPRQVEKIRRDIVNHRWLQTHESICVNKLGNMHDGQHRAEAITKAEMGWPFYCTWNVPPSGIYATDSGERRNENEKLALLFPDLKVTSKTAALARAMMGGLENRNISYTGSEIAAFTLVHTKSMCWIMNNLKSYRSDLQAVMAKALLWWGEAVIGPFVERLRTVQFTGDGDPAKALFLWLQRAREQGKRVSYISPVIYYKKALSAINAHTSGKVIKHVTSNEKDVFEWLPGWKVPEAAPCKGKVFLDEE